MSMLSDLLSKAQQLEIELAKFTQGELGEAKSLAQEIKENLKLEVDKEVGAPPPPANPGAGVQTSSDLNG